MADKVGMVVLDSSNLDAIVKDATGEGLEPLVLPTDSGKPVVAATEKPAEAKKPEGESTEEADDVEGEDGLTPRQKRDLTQKMQTAIGKKHRALKDAEEFAADQYNSRRLAEQRADQHEREIARLKAQLEGSKPVVTDTKPDRAKFDTDEAYRDAMDDWRVDQKFKVREAESKQAEIVAHAIAKIERAKELVPDFVEVTGAVDIQVPPYIAGYMQESDMFAELGYHFAKHPDVLEKLGRMTPAKALVEVGKIESTLHPFAPAAKVENGSKEPSKPNGAEASKPVPSTETGITPSKPRAAAPIKPLSTGSAVQVDKPEHEMTVQEAMQAWQKKRGVRLDRRQRH